MKMSRVEAWDLELPYPVESRAAWSPHIAHKSRAVTFLRVETDAGIVGYGASGRHEADTINRRAAPSLVGRDPMELERHAEIIRAAGRVWLVDMALCDIVGKAAGLPLHRLWGYCQSRVPAYASTIGAGTPEKRAEDALAYLEQGFKAIKLRTHCQTIEEDIRLVEAVRDAVGDRMVIMVDANQAGPAVGDRMPVFDESRAVHWDFGRALATARELEQLGVYWLEEPLPRYQFDQLARLCDSVDINIAGGEGNQGLHEFHWMLRDGVYDILQPDCSMSEGLSKLRKVAFAAELAGKQFIPHHGNSGLGLAAHLQLCSGLRNCKYVEFVLDPPSHTIENHQQLCGIVKTPITIDKDGCVPVPTLPGLGVEVDEGLIGKHVV